MTTDLDPRRGLMRAHAVAAFIAARAPVRYVLVPVPGTELCDNEISICLVCAGRKYIPPPSGVNGWATRCDACHGTGKDMRGCSTCGTAHSIQACPAIRALLFDERSN